MIKTFLSRYHFRYIRSLVYMLQASEYHVSEYVAWLPKVRDFKNVEKRKRLVKTPKVEFLLISADMLAVAVLVAAFSMFWFLSAPLSAVLFFLIMVIAPYAVAYGIIVPLFVVDICIQRPVMFFMLRRTCETLKKHKALKIAIAGSFGKTSMREILKTVLSAGKRVAAPPESYNTPLGVAGFVKKLTGDEEILIFELGEYYPGDVRRLCSVVRPDWGIVTGVNEAHLERFKTLDNAARTIFELGEFLDGGKLYVNGESEFAKKYASPENVLYDRTSVDNWRILDARTGLDGTSFMLARDGLCLDMRSKLLGLHHIGPLAAAADIALRLGFSPAQVEEGIRNTKPFDHRLEPKIDAQGIVTLDDSYNGNPDGVRAVIDFLASLKNHRRFYVTPGLVEMGSQTEEVHRDIGRELAVAGIERIVLIKDSVTPYIEEGLKEKNYQGEIVWFDDALVAFSALPLMTVKGDVVLLQNDWPDQYR